MSGPAAVNHTLALPEPELHSEHQANRQLFWHKKTPAVLQFFYYFEFALLLEKKKKPKHEVVAVFLS